jgi:tetratricopeptide (TPR) repeat protein
MIGVEFFQKGQMEPARLHFLSALFMEPNQPQVLQNLGAVLRNLNFYEASESIARRSVAASGNNPYCLSNLGVAQMALRKYGEALKTLKTVTNGLPDAAPGWHNFALVLYMLGRYEEALKSFDKSLELDSTNSQVQSDRALTLLALERIQDGLESYEVRWKLLANSKIWEKDLPEWKGENLIGSRILVHHEQGFGDSIMLVRFLNPLAKLGCSITLAVPDELTLLFQRSFRFIKVISLTEAEALDNVSAFDYHTPMLSLMRWLGIKTPSEIDASTYLYAKPSEDNRLPDAACRIGICWASGNHGPTLVDRRRVIDLTKFLPLSEIPGVALISLQKGPDTKAIIDNGMEGIVFDITHKFENFAITADYIANLDLVISVDSAVAHIAGAIGKPCLMLSPYTRCWRWWGKSHGWPWYNRMAVYYQSENGNWDSAMKKVISAVREAKVK